MSLSLDSDPAFLASSIADAKSYNHTYRQKIKTLTRELDKLTATWGPEIARLDARYERIISRQEQLRVRDASLGDLRVHQREYARLLRERESGAFTSMDPAPFRALGVLGATAEMEKLPEQIGHLLARFGKLQRAVAAERQVRTVARNRLTALRLMRRRMDRQLADNLAELEDESRSIGTLM
jgi:hypothetical protein